MSVRVQVILIEEEAAKFKSQAIKESKFLSAWFREAGRKMLKMNRQCQPLTDTGSGKLPPCLNDRPHRQMPPL